MTVKAVILIGGPQKGTRFRPLSLELPKPLFPLAGVPMLKHHIEACRKVPNLTEIILMGFYEEKEFSTFIQEVSTESVKIKYVCESQALGTGGGLFFFRNVILEGNPEAIFVLHADVCSSFPLNDMLAFHNSKPGQDHFTLMATRVEKDRAHLYGCVVENPETHEVLHYAEKPETFISDVISCGVYIFTPNLFEEIKKITGRRRASSIGNRFNEEDEENLDYLRSNDTISLERDILSPMSGSGRLFVFLTHDFWTAVKTSGSALYANRCYLGFLRKYSPEKLEAKGVAGKPTIVGDVVIHPSAVVDPSCKLGPNVTIGPDVKLGPGVRVVDSIILDKVEVHANACIIHAIVGWESRIGAWARVEGVQGIPGAGNYSENGRKNNGVTILGKGVEVSAEIVVRNCIVLPHKSLSSSQRNEILL